MNAGSHRQRSGADIPLDTPVLSLVGTWEWDLTSGAATWSNGVFRLLGLEPGFAVPSYDLFVSKIHPDDRPGATDISLMAGPGQTLDAAFRIIRPDGGLRWISSVGEVFQAEDGKPSWAAGVLIDVTDLREAQRALREREERYRALATANSLGVWRATPDGKFLECEFWTDLTGQPKDECHGLGWAQCLHPDDVDAVCSNWLEAIRIGSATEFTYRVRHRSGEYRWIVTKVVPVRNADGAIREWIGSTEDIHARRTAEEALRMNEERLRLALEAAHLVTWDYDDEAGYVTRSDNSLKVLGVGSSPISEYQARIHPTDRERVMGPMAETLETGHPYSVQYRYIGPDGEVRWLHAHARLLCRARKGPARVIGVTQDITPQRAIEAAYEEATKRLGALERRQAALKKVAGDIVWTNTPDGRMADVPAWREFTGQTPVQVQGWGWLNAVHPADRERTRDLLQRIIDCREPQSFRFRLCDRAGTYHWLYAQVAPVVDDNNVVQEWIGAGWIEGPSRDPGKARQGVMLASAQVPVLSWQLRAARAILGWSAAKLAEEAGVSHSTVRRIEEGQGHELRMMSAVQSALEQAGIEFQVSAEGRRSVGIKGGESSA